MKGGVARILTFGFLAFSALFFFLYQPLAHRADYEQALWTATTAQVDEQNKIIAVGPQVDAADSILQLRLQALRSKCAPTCNDVFATADEVAAVSRVAKQSGVAITTRTFNTDGSIDVITESSQGAALRFLDGLQRLPVPIRLTKTTFTADGRKVKMDLAGETVSGATL